MSGQVGSLNVAAAGAVLCYEVSRQRASWRGQRLDMVDPLAPRVKFCLCWRSSGVEQLPCKQWVGGSNPPASASIWAQEWSRVPSHAGRFGEVPKWPKGADCKSAGVRLRGFKSSPPHHLRRRAVGQAPTAAPRRSTGGNSSAVERQPSKLGVAGSNPVSRSIVVASRRTARGWGPGVRGEQCVMGTIVNSRAHVAQLAEHALGKGEVSGSIPDMGSSPKGTDGDRAPGGVRATERVDGRS